jgi:hypothetical protein
MVIPSYSHGKPMSYNVQVYFKATLLTAALGLLTTTLATPLALSPRQNTTAPSTAISSYIGGMCGFAGGSGYEIPGDGTITSGDCFKFDAYAYGVFTLPDISCNFTTYNSNTCNNGTEDTTYQLPAGGAEVCVDGGAYDGGTHTTRSGKYLCTY